ncbi:CAAX geranylgeranyltransferase alpha subunit [Podochytrium sp. JEL0797]|nr:CAAX geranylgeranyltransferase alpha subunit [Podochytrium sp. JEL0797]
MDYFRACARTNETSQRVLELTAQIIELNPAHYTVWKVRQDCLVSLSSDLRKELEYATTVGLEHHKNYQVWHHREVVVSLIGADEEVVAGEIRYINQQLDVDCKNYHAWSYRQWLVRRFNSWSQELSDVNDLLVDDCRNNSAWNHRFFYFTNRPEGLGEDIIKDEIRFCLEHVKRTPNNESPWNYLKGIAKKLDANSPVLDGLLKDVACLIVANEFVCHGASFLLEFLEGKIAAEKDEAKKAEACVEAKNLCTNLIKNDIIRIKFWNYRLSLIPQIV